MIRNQLHTGVRPCDPWLSDCIWRKINTIIIIIIIIIGGDGNSGGGISSSYSSQVGDTCMSYI